VKRESRAYLEGTKLFWNNLKTVRLLEAKEGEGTALTRRELTLIRATKADIGKLVPVLLCFCLPIVGYLVPLVTLLFPSVLPSTFLNDEKKRKLYYNTLKKRRVIASELVPLISARIPLIQAKNPIFFTSNVLESFVLNRDMVLYLQSFEHGVDIDGLSLSELILIAKLLSLFPYLPASMLRNKINVKMAVLHKEDKLLRMEGLNSLPHEELVEACYARSLPVKVDSDMRVMRALLEDWVALSTEFPTPRSLNLILYSLLSHQVNKYQQPYYQVMDHF